MRRRLVYSGFAVCWAMIAGLGTWKLSAGTASTLQEIPGTSAETGSGTAGEPKQIRIPPAPEEPKQMAPDERQRLEQGIEGTHLPGPKSSKGPASQSGPDRFPPTSSPSIRDLDRGGSEGK